MVSVEYEIVEAKWPDTIPGPRKALLDFLESGLQQAEIKGPKDFLVNVRRAQRSSEEIKSITELKMSDNRLYVRRTDKVETSA